MNDDYCIFQEFVVVSCDSTQKVEKNISRKAVLDLICW